MAHTDVDLSTDRTSLDALAKKLVSTGMILAIFGIVATLMLTNLFSSGEGGDGHGAAGNGAATTEMGAHGETADDAHGAGQGDAHGGGHAAHGHQEAWSWYHPFLVNATFFLTISLGALFFVIIHHLTRAGWSTSLRRLAEGTSLNIGLMALIFIPIVLTDGATHLYKWMEPDAGDALIEGKAGYLNHTWFLIRLAIYFAFWFGASFAFHRLSTQQDESGDPKLSRAMGRLTPVAILLFALTVTFASFDLLMSLDAHWFSTIFGVYFFAGCVLSFHAFLALLVIWLQKNGRLEKAVNTEHLQDVGKMIFAFTIFWAYIAFSQYMLYWYANIPEETGWFLRRQESFTWGAWGFMLIFGHFAVPFLFLLSKHVKRRRATLALGAGWVLVMHWCDLYYLVMPQVSNGEVFPFRMLDVTMFLAMAGVYLASTAWILSRHPLVAVRDPRLHESLAFHNV